MLKTSLILFPDSKGLYDQSFRIAVEYHRILYGIFRENTLLAAYLISSTNNLISDDKKTFRIPENILIFDSKTNTLEKSLEQATKFLERRKFSTFHCGRIVFIFPDLTYIPYKDGVIQEDQLYPFISKLTHNGEEFDKLFCDIFIYTEDLQNQNEYVSTDNISIYILNKENANVPNILKQQLNLSSISTTNGFYALFKNNTSETLDIVANHAQEGTIIYLEKNSVIPLINFSTNLVLCLNETNRKLIENDFKIKVLLIITPNQSYMISYSRNIGYRLSYITPTTPDVHPSFYFNPVPCDQNLSNFYLSLPLLLQIGQLQPGFLFKRGEPSLQLSRVLSLASDKNVLVLFSALKEDTFIRGIASDILSSLVSPNLNINKVNNAKKAITEFYNLYMENSQNEPMKVALKVLYRGILAISSTFQGVTQIHKDIYNNIAQLEDQFK